MWSGLSWDVSAWARACVECLQSKVHQHVRSTVPRVPVPARRFSHIRLDLVGPLPSSRGFTYLFTILNRTSWWPEAVPLSSISAAHYARALIIGWILRFGVPAKITLDCRAQFTSSFFPPEHFDPVHSSSVQGHRGTFPPFPESLSLSSVSRPRPV